MSTVCWVPGTNFAITFVLAVLIMLCGGGLALLVVRVESICYSVEQRKVEHTCSQSQEGSGKSAYSCSSRTHTNVGLNSRLKISYRGSALVVSRWIMLLEVTPMLILKWANLHLDELKVIR